MRIGFLVWNSFQVGHFAELMKEFDEPDVIFVDHDTSGLSGFDPQWLTRYGAYSRFISETELSGLDGQYDAILTQFTPPLPKPWKQTKLIMCQYSMAKPKTAYNARWTASDFGVVYGEYSDKIIGNFCPTVQAGNSRFDPYFEGRLDQDTLTLIRSRLDPTKRSLAFLPTWGDLSSQAKFKEALGSLLPHYNVIYKPHHMTPLHDSEEALSLGKGSINANELAQVLDIGPYLMDVSDIVVSDMSGIIFDAIYCRKPVVLLGLDQSLEDHKKADPSALEVASTHRIGPVVRDVRLLRETIDQMISENPFRNANEELVKESFLQRGGCAPVAANGIRAFLQNRHHSSIDTANVRGPILEKAYVAAVIRKQTAQPKPSVAKFSNARRRSLMQRTLSQLPAPLLLRMAKTSSALGARRVESYLYHRALESGGREAITKWMEAKKNKGARPISPNAAERREMLARLQDQGEFFDIGLEVEAWANSAPDLARKALYNFYCAAGNLRYSRTRLRQLHAELTAYARDEHSSERAVRRAILRDLGLLTEAIEMEATSYDPGRDRLKDTLELLGAMAQFVDRAAYNDTVEPPRRLALTPQNRWLPIAEIKEPVFEVSIMLSFTRTVGDDDDGTRKAMIDVTRHMIDTLHRQGWAILPCIQAGHRGAAPITGRFPSATWHTTHTGVPGQIHLKVGSFNSHIIIDDRGYSGWSSLARKDLATITAPVQHNEAEQQLSYLQASLVAGRRSKFKQQDEPVPSVGRYVFFPMQVMTDAVAQLAFVDGLTLLRELSRWAQGAGYTVIVKRHPKCVVADVATALKEEQGAGRIVVSNASIHDLISGADAVVTVNSGVGAEALLHLKPVITTGGSDYGAATRVVKNREELRSALDELPKELVPTESVKRFLWAYTKRYQVHPQDTAAIEARVTELVGAP